MLKKQTKDSTQVTQTTKRVKVVTLADLKNVAGGHYNYNYEDNWGKVQG